MQGLIELRAKLTQLVPACVSTSRPLFHPNYSSSPCGITLDFMNDVQVSFLATSMAHFDASDFLGDPRVREWNESFFDYYSNITNKTIRQLDHHNPRFPGLVIGYCVGECVLSIIIIIGNLLVVLSFLRFRALRRENVNIFLFHLSVADLLVGLTLPLHVTMFLVPSMLDNKGFCLFMFCSLTFTGGLSMLLLNLLAIHQLLSIYLPYRYNAWVTPKRLHIIVGLAYAYSAVIAGMPLVGVNTYTPESKCDLVRVFPPAYLFVALVGHVVVLMISVCIMYAVLMCKALHFIAQNEKQTESVLHNVDPEQEERYDSLQTASNGQAERFHRRSNSTPAVATLAELKNKNLTLTGVNSTNRTASSFNLMTFPSSAIPMIEINEIATPSRCESPRASSDESSSAATNTAPGLAKATTTHPKLLSVQNGLSHNINKIFRKTSKISLYDRSGSIVTNQSSAANFRRQQSTRTIHAEYAKAMRSFILVTVCTVVCTLPFVIAVPIEYCAIHYPLWQRLPLFDDLSRVRFFTLAAILLVIAHSSANPIIYALRMEGFKMAFSAMFRRRSSSFVNASLQGY